jgi:hypothetical protein
MNTHSIALGHTDRLVADRARSHGLAVPILLTLLVLFGIGCTTIPVAVDFDTGTDFATFQTYAWLPNDADMRTNPRLHNDLLDARVRRSMDAALQSRGFRKVEEAEADFLVTYYLGVESRIDVRTVHSTFSYSRRGWGGTMGTDTRVRQYDRGTMLIDVLHPGERRLVWRGSASSRVTQTNDLDRRQRQIDQAVESILKRFPPS